jgi:Methyltransferase FkbM domain
MDGLRQPQISRTIASGGLLNEDPFLLLDVGCSGGIHPSWRTLTPHLVAYGFDPDRDEVARLRRSERSPGIAYVEGFVGPRADDPFVISRGERSWWSNNPWPRLAAAHFDPQEGVVRASEQPQEVRSEPSGSRIDLSSWMASHAIERVDFLKVDTDGEDLAILASLAEDLRQHRFVGVGVEVNFFGTAEATDHTFHNVDRMLRESGYELFDLSVRHYSSAKLPYRFSGRGPGPSAVGRVFQGDAVYIRDMAAPGNCLELGEWSPAQIAKLVCLFDVVGLPDCAAEILCDFGERLDQDLARDLLNRLVPRRGGRKILYEAYVAQAMSNDRFLHQSSLHQPIVRARKLGRRSWDAATARFGTRGGKRF